MQFPKNMHYEIVLIKIGSEMPSVALVKKSITLKKLSAECRKVIFHPYGEKAPVN